MIEMHLFVGDLMPFSCSASLDALIYPNIFTSFSTFCLNGRRRIRSSVIENEFCRNRINVMRSGTDQLLIGVEEKDGVR
jgi:hypothetical protein